MVLKNEKGFFFGGSNFCDHFCASSSFFPFHFFLVRVCLSSTTLFKTIKLFVKMLFILICRQKDKK